MCVCMHACMMIAKKDDHTCISVMELKSRKNACKTLLKHLEVINIAFNVKS